MIHWTMNLLRMILDERICGKTIKVTDFNKLFPILIIL